MRELGRLLCTYCSQKHTASATHLSFVQVCLNYSVHQSTNSIPFELHYGTAVSEKINQMFPLLEKRPVDREFQIELGNKKLQRAFEQRGRQHEKKSKVSLHAVDLVLIRVPHLSIADQRQIYKSFDLYGGPFRIEHDIGRNAFFSTPARFYCCQGYI